MAGDRSVRFLSALGGASTSRVLNLYRIDADHAHDPQHAEKPLFLSPLINRSFLLKHRTRADESYLFPGPSAVATKIIIPFDFSDLQGRRTIAVRGPARLCRHAALGGQLYQRRRWTATCGCSGCSMPLPSLDPFLLREHLRNNKIEVAPSYFAISEGDQTAHA